MAPFLRYWLPLIAYCVFIFVQSSGESPVDLPSVPGVDKVLHAGGYGLLGVLFYRAYRSRWPNASGWATANASLLSAAFYGFTDELHQAFVPVAHGRPLRLAGRHVSARCWGSRPTLCSCGYGRGEAPAGAAWRN